MTTQNSQNDEPTNEKPSDKVLPWLRANIDDLKDLNFEGPIFGSAAADSHELSDMFRAAVSTTDQGAEPADTAAVRVFNMLSAITGVRFTPEHRNDSPLLQ